MTAARTSWRAVSAVLTAARQIVQTAIYEADGDPELAAHWAQLRHQLEGVDRAENQVWSDLSRAIRDRE